MRVAFVSPLPPSPSGIADYSAALLDPLRKHSELTVFDREALRSDLDACDIALYQIGNNGHHAFVYDAVLQHPGVVVLHEANLHHLITDVTIRRGDWDGYLAEAEYNGGAPALAHARRVREGIVGPDYEGVSMLRRLLERAKGLIVHSRWVGERAIAAGYSGPIARIPHGVWLPELDGDGWRKRLGLSPDDVLFGIFGHLKPYKRVREAVRAFARVAREHPEARLVLVGEPHPDLPVQPLLDSLGLQAQARLIGRAPIEEFEGYLSACDVVLNLRYPTVGESSGTMMRAFGLGKPVVVSAVGAFAEFPDDVCLKAPVDYTEEEYLAEYMELLVSRPDLRAHLGANARRWAERECAWPVVAARYAGFLAAVAGGTARAGWWQEPEEPAHAAATALAAGDPRAPENVPASSNWEAKILRWCADEQAKAYAGQHITRLSRTLSLVPRARPGQRILEMGAYLQITPLLEKDCGYEEVRGCYYGPAGRSEARKAVSQDGDQFSCTVDLFNAETDPFPYPDGHFHTILCCELIEHLHVDPMHMMGEINRILAPGGVLILTTPNISSLRALSAIFAGYHPGFFPAYIRPAEDGSVDARHAREYTPREIYRLLEDSGLEVLTLDTGPFRQEASAEFLWVESILAWHDLDTRYRGECIFAVGRKVAAAKQRYPDWLYSG